jgi:hypothetical protein
MNKIKKLLVITLITGFAFNVNGQAAVQVTGTLASARLVAPLGITLNAGTDLAFGSVALPAIGAVGTIILDPKLGTRALTGVTEIGAGTITGFGFPTYVITGEPGLVYTLTLPSNTAVTVALSTESTTNPGTWTANTGGTAASMNVTNFSSATAADTNKVTGTRSNLSIGSAAADNTYVVGAQLDIASGQATGYYRGTYTVTAQYN